MSIRITITGHSVGSQLLYELPDRGGRRQEVPTYRAFLEHDSGAYRFQFAVTRDTSPVTFGDGVYHYDTGGECPPSRRCAPYRVRVHDYRESGLAFALYEDRLDGRSSLHGIGATIRRSILIHQGPGRSLGCMMVAGDALDFVRLYLRYEQIRANYPDDCFLCTVEPRHFGAENPLSSL